MVNADSDLAPRASGLGARPGRTSRSGRNQYVLDMAKPGGARSPLRRRSTRILSAYQIDYVKWDHNRVLPFRCGPGATAPTRCRQAARGAHPEVEFESCASGGGRIDFGILAQTQRVWLSDSQRRAGAPAHPARRGAAAAARRHRHPCRPAHLPYVRPHLSIRFRAWVAAQRHMGFEMDPRELTEDEARRCARHRMVESRTATGCAPRHPAAGQRRPGRDRRTAPRARRRTLRCLRRPRRTSDQIAPRPLRLTGLDPEARYRIALFNSEDATPGLSRGYSALKQGALELSGQYLMGYGMTLPWSFPERMWVIEGERT